jgi:hypothetical protein
MADRSWFEEYLYRRTKSAAIRSQLGQQEPRDSKRRINLIIRFLGIIVPMAFCYGLGALYFGKNGNLAGYWVARSLGAAAWIGFAGALSLRRDWPGAAATAFVYIFFDAWLWMTVIGP